MNRLLAAGLTAVLLTIGANSLPSMSATSTKVINSCVKTKTGELRISKKCSKGETSLSWNTQGIQGIPGPAGSPAPSASANTSVAQNALVVLDSNNQIVGYPVGITGVPDHSLPEIGMNGATINGFTVFIPSINRVITLMTNGKPYALELYFTSADCSGDAYYGWDNESTDGAFSPLYANVGGQPGWWDKSTSATLPISYHSHTDWQGTCITANSGLTSNNGGKAFKYERIANPLPAIAGPIRIAVR